MRRKLTRRIDLQFSAVVFSIVLMALSGGSVVAADWAIPFAGNTYRQSSEKGRPLFTRDHILRINHADVTASVYFHMNRAANVRFSVVARSPQGGSVLSFQCGEKKWETRIDGETFSQILIGDAEITKAGYVRLDFQNTKSGERPAELQSLIVSSDAENLDVEYVKNNDGNMFYWGRRGPSVHLGYQTPAESRIQYAYSEIKVPAGQDVIGSYYMANGFAEGYFGIQVNGPQERRVLFSVWSPFVTDDPKSIPEEERIVLVAKGAGVVVGEFGNEGSGGQSYLVFPWKADVTYRFLTEVTPVDGNRTRYTSWFSEAAKDNSDPSTSTEWKLVASFLRPKTSTDFKGFHSFLENFHAETGNVTRSANYQNPWVCDVDGLWTECLNARFTVDGTGGARQRLDFQGGVEGSHFYLKNCGFFDGTTTPGTILTRGSTASRKPNIDFTALDRTGS